MSHGWNINMIVINIIVIVINVHLFHFIVVPPSKTCPNKINKIHNDNCLNYQ